MFGLFKKERKPSVKDVVFIDRPSQLNALLHVAQQTPAPLFVTWFDDAQEELQRFFDTHGSRAEVIMYRQLHPCITGNRPVIFAGHFPLAAKEQQSFKAIETADISIYSSLDDAFFSFFGGENIAKVIEKMGMNKNEAISHPLVTASIKRAQEKIAGRILVEQSAQSIDEWFRRNVPSHA